MTVEFDIGDLRVLAEGILKDVDEGPALDEQTRVLTHIAVCSAATTMDVAGTGRHIEEALDLGLDATQIQEALTVVSGLGVHTLFEASRQLSSAVLRRGGGEAEPLDASQQDLWDRHIGTDPYWQRMEDELPGFFDALLRMSPETFVAFFDYCAVPWKSRALRAVTKGIDLSRCRFHSHPPIQARVPVTPEERPRPRSRRPQHPRSSRYRGSCS